MKKYKIQTPGRYLVKNDEKTIIGEDRTYFAEDIEGWSSPAHRLLVREVTEPSSTEQFTFFPGQTIHIPVEAKKQEAPVQTIDELSADKKQRKARIAKEKETKEETKTEEPAKIVKKRTTRKRAVKKEG